MSQFISRSERYRLERRRRKEQRKRVVRDWILAIVIAMGLAAFIRLFLFEPTSVSGPSMRDTLFTGDQVIVDKLVYYISDPKPGEIVVFRAGDRDLIKRVVAVAGDTVEARNNQLYVNGKKIEEPYLSKNAKTADFGPVKVPKGYIFVLGDNRQNSTDSRILGPIPLSNVIGRADLIYLPISRFKFLN
jgi:signal peptidase I